MIVSKMNILSCCHAEDSTLCEARKQQSEGGDLTGHHAQDMYSDSDYSGLDTDEV